MLAFTDFYEKHLVGKKSSQHVRGLLVFVVPEWWCANRWVYPCCPEARLPG